MRKNYIVTIFTLLIALLLATPSLAGFEIGCKQADVTLSAIKDKPGLYVGSFTGGLSGAVSLFTLRETILRDGTIMSLIELTYVSPLADATFNVLLDVVDSPSPEGYDREAQGEITDGTGRFASVTGDVSMTGRLAVDSGRLKASGKVRLCR